MRSLYRAAALALASTLLFYFGSCERHKPDELSHGEHGHLEHAAPDAEHAESHPSATPAQFFASPTPH